MIKKNQVGDNQVTLDSCDGLVSWVPSAMSLTQEVSYIYKKLKHKADASSSGLHFENDFHEPIYLCG